MCMKFVMINMGSDLENDMEIIFSNKNCEYQYLYIIILFRKYGRLMVLMFEEDLDVPPKSRHLVE